MTTTHPSGRFSAAAAEDELHHDLVLFGGYDGVEALGDTWVWSRGAWSLTHPATSPSPRFGHAMTYDSAMGEVVLYGGQTGPNSVVNDMWGWNGTDWKAFAVLGGPPYGKAFAAMAFDQNLGQVVLTGVYPDSNLSTWTLTGSGWTRHPSTAADQPWANGVQAAYLPSSKVVFMFVYGPRSPDPPSQLLAWNGESWSPVDSTPLPPARSGAAFAYCPALRQVLLFGGLMVRQTQNGADLGDPLSDTWSWDGGHWTELD